MYKEMYETAKKNNRLEELNVRYLTWDEEDQYIIGRFLSSDEVESKNGQSRYRMYLFDTDVGKVRFALGYKADTEIFPLMEVGEVYYIQYLGQVKLPSGRHLNQFEVKHILSVEDIPFEDESSDDVPF